MIFIEGTGEIQRWTHQDPRVLPNNSGEHFFRGGKKNEDGHEQNDEEHLVCGKWARGKNEEGEGYKWEQQKWEERLGAAVEWAVWTLIRAAHLAYAENIEGGAVEGPDLETLRTQRLNDHGMSCPCEVCHRIVSADLVSKALVIVWNVVQIPDCLPRFCHIGVFELRQHTRPDNFVGVWLEHYVPAGDVQHQHGHPGHGTLVRALPSETGTSDYFRLVPSVVELFDLEVEAILGGNVSMVLVVDSIGDVKLGEGLPPSPGLHVDCSPNIGHRNVQSCGDSFSSNADVFGDVRVRQVNHHSHGRQVLDVVVVGIPDECLQGNDGVNSGDEASHPHPHGVEPSDYLILEDSDPTTLDHKECEQSISSCLDSQGIVDLPVLCLQEWPVELVSDSVSGDTCGAPVNHSTLGALHLQETAIRSVSLCRPAESEGVSSDGEVVRVVYTSEGSFQVAHCPVTSCACILLCLARQGRCNLDYD